MKIELKGLKVHSGMSQETECFEASIWIDGKRAATVQNSGHGGPHMFHFSDRELEQKFYDYCKSLPPLPVRDGAPDWEVEMGPLSMDAELYISGLVEAVQSEKWIKRQTRTKVLFALKGDEPGSYRTYVKVKTEKQRIALHKRIVSEYGDNVREIHGTPFELDTPLEIIRDRILETA